MLTEKIIDDWKHCTDTSLLLSHIQAVNVTYSQLTKFDQLDGATRKV